MFVAWIRVLSLAGVTAFWAALAVAGRVVTLGAPGPGLRFAVRCCRGWCRAAARLLGVRTEVRGTPEVGVGLAVANHLSYLDIFVLGSLFPTVFVAKAEIARWPLFGGIARLAGTVFVRRDSRRALHELGERIAATIDRGITVTLFPEGRISHGAEVLPFQPSLLAPAVRGGVRCQPITLTYRTTDAGVLPSEEICWPTSQPIVPHLLKVASLRDLRVIVRIGDPVDAAPDRKVLARTLHDRVAAAFDPVPQTRGA